MPKTLLQTSGQGAAYTAGVTRFAYLANARQTSNSVENNVRVRFRAAGTLSKLSVLVAANATTASSTVNVRKNTANGNQSITISSATTGTFQDASNTDTVAAGDYLAVRIVVGTGGSISIFAASTAFDATTNSSVLAVSNTSNSSASTTIFSALQGNATASSTEADFQIKVQKAGTLKNFGVNVTTNGRGTSSTAKSRINGVDGNLSVTISASTTGYFEDTSNSDTIAVDDLVCLSLTTGTGAGTVAVTTASEFQVSDLGPLPTYAHGSRTINQNVTCYLPLSSLQEDTTESDVSGEINFAAVLSNMNVQISANTVSATSTMRSRINAADGNQVISIGASTTGYFEDASNTDTIASGDDVNYSLVTGTGGTSLTITYTSMLIKEIVSPTISPAVQSATFSLPTTNVVIGQTAAASVLTSAFSLPTPSLQIDSTSSASVLAIATSTISPTVDLLTVATPSVSSGAFILPSSAVVIDCTFSGTVLSSSFGLQSPTVVTGNIIEAPVLSLGVSLLTPLTFTTGIKSSTTWVNASKSSAPTFSNQSKNSSSWSAQSKSSDPTYGNGTKSTTTWTAQDK